MSQNSWQETVEVVNKLSQIIEGVDLENMEDGSVDIEKAKEATRKITRTLAGLYAITKAGRFHPDLNKIPTLEKALISLDRITGVMPVREATDLCCRIETAEGRFEIFNRLLQEAENTGPVREVGKLVEFDYQDGSKGTRVEFLPEVNMPKGIPPKVWQAQVRAYDPQTRETTVYFPRDWRNEDHFLVAKALRGLYERAHKEHREFKAEKDAQREAEKPYFEQSTLGSLKEALVEGKDGVIAFGFNYQEQYSDKPRVRGVVVVEAKAGKLQIKDLTPSFEGIEGLEKGTEYPFTAGERPDLRRVPRSLKFMLLTVLNSIRRKSEGTETGQGKTGPEEKTPPPVETKPQRRTRKLKNKHSPAPEERKEKRVSGPRRKIDIQQTTEGEETDL